MADIPTIPEDVRCLESQSYFSQVPEAIRECAKGDAIILGVDEAGRGPVLGPMVYGVAYCTREYQDTEVCRHGFDDSKKLTDPIRRKLFRMIYSGELNGIGFATTAITPADISGGMLRYPPEYNYNLNEQAHDVTMALIQGVLDSGVALDHVYVDTVGPPLTYQNKLERRFPSCKFTVAKKADSLYPVVSIASVIAKVTRDVWLELLKSHPGEELGSGYPGDQKTIAWLRANLTPLLGWDPAIVRFSWQTSRTLLENSPEAIKIEWEEDASKKKASRITSSMLQPNQPLNITSNVDAVISLDAWYGHENKI
ncbi:HCL478Wp [Eremothecium sinecaudum]|uniref:Ribonuclease n=1 Tax=Eremothecium sinecaudum TaxID=45286 RepID=A0A109UYA1_9SACH|nr:HCL478Wp [Eremothecium sinecaudum]AMD19673.1 HCL478Wp [Eremothecium sinecaudum]